jgi:hypothetical protein
MADITMCVHKGCRQEISCYRKRAIASDWQSMADLYEAHPSDLSINCINFIAIEGRKIEPLLNRESV